MHVFAITLLFGLGVTAVSLLGERFMDRQREFRALASIAIGIGAAWVTHFDVWGLWGVPVRGDWIGVTFTGLLLAGIGYVWQVLLGFFAGMARKLNDQAEAMEKEQGLRRVA